MKIFISWSKNKSEKLAKETQNFFLNTFGKSVEVFFSPEMYKGTCVDHVIHEKLLNSDKCIVCLTSENYKNPWLMYEAGVVYGAHYKNTTENIIIPILFEPIPKWSSWIDKPLNRYAPIQIRNDSSFFPEPKEEFLNLFSEISKKCNIKIKNFERNWKMYFKNVQKILKEEQFIPESCIDLVNKLIEDKETFSMNSPEITKDHIFFHRGFSTISLFKILLKNITDFQGKRLWIYGRRNKKLFTGENDYFFKFLAEEGIRNGVDFRCLFPYPESDATINAVSLDKERRFKEDLHTCLEAATRLEKRFGLDVSKLFRLYKCVRKSSIIISDDALLYSPIICGSDGRPLPITNSSFEILDISQKKGNELCNTFINVWDNAVPLTEELYNKIYNKDI